MYADGYRSAVGDATPGSRGMVIGALDDQDVLGTSGGWIVDLNLDTSRTARLSLRYRLALDPGFDPEQYGEVRASIDGESLRDGDLDYIARVSGGQDALDTGWTTFETDLGTLGSGWHRVVIGLYNNSRTEQAQWMNLLLDEVRITASD